MSSAVAIRDDRLAWDLEYEPIADATREIHRIWKLRRDYLRGSASDWYPILEGALSSIKDNCSNANWDGPNAIPVTDRTIRLTAQIAEILYAMVPRGTPAPDLIPEADGEICISWTVTAHRVFSLSIAPHGKINFAGQFGEEGAIHAWQSIDTTNRRALQESLQDVARYIGRIFAPPTERRAT
ncbi:MAG: hypothetical protein L0Z50_18240 [Verrucomicrobiales bacterium]|nr:hypothetical protein [Verrucomicrobiales bacterium]